jgi:flagellar basal body-associated protein FliL
MSEEKHAEQAGSVAPKKSGNLKVIIIAVIAALIGAGGALAAFFILGEHPPQAQTPEEQADEGSDADGHEDKKKKKKKKKKGEGEGEAGAAATYMRLDNLTVNLSGGRDHFLAVSMELKLAEPQAQAHLTERLPEVKNLVLITLSAQTPDSLSSVDGKTALAQKLRDDLNALIDEDEETGVENVFFTQFIIQ